MSQVVLGVDIGGTFTDLLLLDTGANRYRIAKIPTTSSDQSVGFMNGVHALGHPLEGFEAIIPRELRLEVSERMDAEGNVVTPLDEGEVRTAIERLLALRAEALVI